MTRGMGMENIFMHDINHFRYASKIVWNVDVVVTPQKYPKFFFFFLV